MKKTVKILMLSAFVILTTTEVNATIIRVSVDGVEICVSWGKDKGACKQEKGVHFTGREEDYSVSINGKEVSAKEIEIKSKNSQQVQVAIGKEVMNSTLDKILIKNKKTGETISLFTIMQVRESCDG